MPRPQVVRDAREHGVPVRPVCVLASGWDCTLERADGPLLAVRLGLRMVRGLSRIDADRLVARRAAGGWHTIETVHRRTGLPQAVLERIAQADGFHAFGLPRRDALWVVRGLGVGALPLFDRLDGAAPEPATALAPLGDGGEVAADYRSVGLSLHRHPVSLLRPALRARSLHPCSVLDAARDGQRLGIAGIVLMRQKPGSAKGVMFMTVEDEAGIGNLVIWPSLFARQRSLILSAGLLGCHGRVQRAGTVVHLVAERLEDLTPLLRGLEHGGLPDGRGQAPIRVPTRDFR